MRFSSYKKELVGKSSIVFVLSHCPNRPARTADCASGGRRWKKVVPSTAVRSSIR